MTDNNLPPLPVGMKEIDDLWDHVYEYTHISEGTHERLERVCHAYAHALWASLLAYRDAIDEELVTIQSTADSFPTPKAALSALLNWHVLVALDPTVSSDAQKLIDDARAPLLAEIERLRACIAEVREHAEYIVGADWPSSVRRLHARETLVILDRHAADGGGNA